MKRTTLLVGIFAALAVSLLAVMGSGGGTASADNGPHVMDSGVAPDKCAGCHRIHTAKSDFLFKEGGTVEDFCYSCHGIGGPGSDLAAEEGTFYGETTAGEPYGSKTPSTTVGLRAGGFAFARINTLDPNNSLSSAPTATPAGYTPSIGILGTPVAVNSQHTIDGSAGTMWGYGAPGTPGVGISNSLHCTSCHDPHGNGNYRILRSRPLGVASNVTPYPIADTLYPKTATSYTTGNYFNMYFAGVPTPATITNSTATPAPGYSILVDTSKWCSLCHTRYLARSGRFVPPFSEASRADSGDTTFQYRHTSAGWGLTVPTPPSTATPAVSFNNRACITCHAAHGSNSSMPGDPVNGTNFSSTVPYPDGSTPAPGDSRGALLKMDNRGMCRKCHSIYRVP